MDFVATSGRTRNHPKVDENANIRRDFTQLFKIQHWVYSNATILTEILDALGY